MPKEMLPIVDKPIIQLVVEELVEAGIQDIILVTKWDKKALEDHFDHNWALTNELREPGKLKQLEEITRISEMANFVYIRAKRALWKRYAGTVRSEPGIQRTVHICLG
jgi:UTP--glucose-1-phosphate uridylyltransferase